MLAAATAAAAVATTGMIISSLIMNFCGESTMGVGMILHAPDVTAGFFDVVLS